MRKQFGIEPLLQSPGISRSASNEGTCSASIGSGAVQPAISTSNAVVPQCTLEGSRIVNVSELAKAIHTLTSHSANCGGSCVLEGETMHSGLAVIFSATCTKCKALFPFSSSPRVQTSEGKRWAVNLGAVLGHMSTGGGQQRLNTTLAYLEVPGMPKRMFSATETLLGEEMKKQLSAAMIEAGKEEREQAISIGSFHQGVPAITVVADGGWSKRSHKHSYNAKSGVAIIFGHYTKKLLFLGVRNKFCSVCTVARNKTQEPPPHRCYLNWTGSSVAMESDIISEGFRQAEEMHGLRYIRVIADGDSSMMCTIRQSVVYGIFVEKIECANHACKCYRSRLEQLAKDHPVYRGRGGLTKRAIQRITIGARLAIKMHSHTGNVKQLQHDLRNGVAHVFGQHSKCNPEFCKKSITVLTEETSHADDEPFSVSNENAPPDSFQQQLEEIIDGESVESITAEDEENARQGRMGSLDTLPDGLYNNLMSCCDRIWMLAPQLITNQTSNLAECYMSVRCHFDGGKYYNRVQSGSFEHRSYGAGLRFQNGPSWPLDFWKNTTGENAGKVNVLSDSCMHVSAKMYMYIFPCMPLADTTVCTYSDCLFVTTQVLTTYMQKQTTQREKESTRKQGSAYQTQRKTARYSGRAEPLQQHDYGLHSQQPDPSPECLKSLCEEFYAREVVVDTDKAQYIEANSRQQADSSFWFQQRRLRITASSFGKVAKRRKTTPVANLVKSLLYSKELNTSAIRWGRTHEDDARRSYVAYLREQGHHKATVSSSGLVVDIDEPCLACSPDGLVEIPGASEPLGVVEFKCPYSLKESGSSPQQAAVQSKTFCCSEDKSGTITLKRNHDYHFQVQGNMAITKRHWADFVIWTPSGLFVEHIEWDPQFWEAAKDKLVTFYKKAVLPELALPRLPRGQAIREPEVAG